ncbi:MAG: hypothetical protein K6G03_07740 [Lachnospiraceae bacterium]|nr:hypothetical protein [Lachnospiraceae bacterium]
MNDMDSFMNAIIYIGGAYLIFSAIMMKTKGTVSSTFLSRDLDWSTARDKEGYIKVMFPVNLVMGLIMIATGVTLTYEAKLGTKGITESIILLVAFIIVIIYGIIAMKAQNKYLK